MHSLLNLSEYVFFLLLKVKDLFVQSDNTNKKNFST